METPYTDLEVQFAAELQEAFADPDLPPLTFEHALRMARRFMHVPAPEEEPEDELAELADLRNALWNAWEDSRADIE